MHIAAAVVFSIARITDFFGGYFGRKRDFVSN